MLSIVELLKKTPFCEGIIYSGSRADGDFSKTSDYDFIVLIGKGKSYFKIFRYKGILVDISCSTAKVLDKLDIVRSKIANSELNILAYGKILYDKSGKMKSIQQKAKKVWMLGPKKYTKNDLKEAGYVCFNSVHKLSKRGSELSYDSWDEIMGKITKLFFELHSKWKPKSSLREESIKKIDRNFFKLYEKVYRATPKMRIDATKRMIFYLVKKFKLPQTGESFSPRE